MTKQKGGPALTPQRRASESARSMGIQRRYLDAAREALRLHQVFRAKMALAMWRGERALWRELRAPMLVERAS